MLKIDQYAYANNLLTVHPLEKFILAISLLIICLATSSNLISILIIGIMLLLTVGLAKIPLNYYYKLMLVPFAFLLIGTLTIALSIEKAPTDFWIGLNIGPVAFGIHFASLFTALNIFLKSLGAVSCLYFLALTTPMLDIIYVLRKCKVPKLFLELMALIYRFIFILLDTVEKMKTSQGTRLGYASFKNSYYSIGILAANLFSRAYQQSEEMTTAMFARCYTNEINVLENEYVLSAKNLVLITFLIIFFVSAALFV
ncbi:cobalt ECF transporter T component CbiQ [Bacillota bacterium LX-D]|nr:cobalt ECF transporter T component CbiQ [Bacillota bacterium LX-D]